jgi:hypothetical protein
MTVEHIRAAEVAKMIRKDLKAAFPGTKFSVRKRDFNCVTINWTDGPTEMGVEDITYKYLGGGFDSMIDLPYSWVSFISPSGKIGIAKCEGTEGSMGTVPGHDGIVPYGSRLVRFDTKYIFTNRAISPANLIAASERVVKKYALDPKKDWIEPTTYGVRISGDYIPEADKWFDLLVNTEAYDIDYTKEAA